jgi:PadR family transcriptional regulator, regulatory protein PadR
VIEQHMPIDQQEKTSSNWMKEAQKGYIRVAVLILVNKKPSHGYEIMKDIKNRTQGFWKPTAGGVYPVLRSLEKAGYIEGDWAMKKNRKVKTYQITESGKQILTRTLFKQNEIATSMNSLFQEFFRDVLNVENPDFPFQAMASPFSAFLEEETQQPEETRKHLEHKRDHLKEIVGTLQEELDRLEKRLNNSTI